MKVNAHTYKSITLITTPGKGMPVVEALYALNIPMVDLYHARGSHIGAPLKKNGMPVEAEQEIVTCVVEGEIANEIFANIYEIAGVDQPGGGFMYMRTLSKCSGLTLPSERSA